MAVFELEEAPRDVTGPFDARRSPSTREDSYLAAMRAELDGFFVEMRDFDRSDIVDVFMHLAAYNARASEIRMQVVRIDSRRLNAFRTRELDPFLETCEFQFKVWSRLQSVRQMEVDLTRGAM